MQKSSSLSTADSLFLRDVMKVQTGRASGSTMVDPSQLTSAVVSIGNKQTNKQHRGGGGASFCGIVDKLVLD